MSRTSQETPCKHWVGRSCEQKCSHSLQIFICRILVLHERVGPTVRAPPPRQHCAVFNVIKGRQHQHWSFDLQFTQLLLALASSPQLSGEDPTAAITDTQTSQNCVNLLTFISPKKCILQSAYCYERSQGTVHTCKAPPTVTNHQSSIQRTRLRTHKVTSFQRHGHYRNQDWLLFHCTQASCTTEC